MTGSWGISQGLGKGGVVTLQCGCIDTEHFLKYKPALESVTFLGENLYRFCMCHEKNDIKEMPENKIKAQPVK